MVIKFSYIMVKFFAVFGNICSHKGTTRTKEESYIFSKRFSSFYEYIVAKLVSPELSFCIFRAREVIMRRIL